jgi:N6-adenosine-specific RNA methylase IME4
MVPDLFHECVGKTRRFRGTIHVSFARGERPNWTVWGNQAEAGYKPSWKTYAYNSAVAAD